jgi:hypothetical protein
MYKEYNSIQTENYEPLLEPIYINKLFKRKINYSVIFIYFILFIILTMQVFNFIYVYKIATTLEKLNSLDIDDINVYINKTKYIINYVCENLIEC